MDAAMHRSLAIKLAATWLATAAAFALAADTAAPADSPPVQPGQSERSPSDDEDVRTALLSGRVRRLADALKQRGIDSYEGETKGQVVLVTPAGQLVPIVPDWRGRAFYQDERLRERPVDLIVKRREGVPWVQVLSIYTFDEKGVRNLTDYWCDLCSIPMYEIKECECCQGPVRLRFRPQELPDDLRAPASTKKSAVPSRK